MPAKSRSMSTPRSKTKPKARPKPKPKPPPDAVVYRAGAFRLGGGKHRFSGVNTFLDERVLSNDLTAAQSASAAAPQGQRPFCLLSVVPTPLVQVSLASSAETKLSSYQRGLSGMGKGRYVHAQIRRLLDARRKQAREGSQTATAEKWKRAPSSSSSAASSSLPGVGHLHPETRLVLDCLKRLKLVIVDCEVVVHWPGKNRFATAVDLVCWNAQEQCYVVVELKTGKRNVADYHRSTSSLRFNARCVVSEFGRHCLQLLVEEILFEKRFPQKTLGPSILIHVPDHTHGVAYGLPPPVAALKSKVTSLL